MTAIQQLSINPCFIDSVCLWGLGLLSIGLVLVSIDVIKLKRKLRKPGETACNS